MARKRKDNTNTLAAWSRLIDEMAEANLPYNRQKLSDMHNALIVAVNHKRWAEAAELAGELAIHYGLINKGDK